MRSCLALIEGNLLQMMSSSCSNWDSSLPISFRIRTTFKVMTAAGFPEALESSRTSSQPLWRTSFFLGSPCSLTFFWPATRRLDNSRFYSESRLLGRVQIVRQGKLWPLTVTFSFGGKSVLQLVWFETLRALSTFVVWPWSGSENLTWEKERESWCLPRVWCQL